MIGLVIAVAVAGGIAAALVFYGLANKKRIEKITGTETSAIASVRDGFVEVKGRVRPRGQPLVSPLTRKPCVYYRFHVEQEVRSGKSTTWRTVIDDRKDGGCLLEDQTGRCEVNLLAAELILETDTKARSGTFHDASAELEATLQGYGVSSQGLVFNKTMRYAETLLEDGDELYALGTATFTGQGPARIDKGTDLFIVSDKSEEQLVSSLKTKMILQFVFGVLIGVGGLGLLGVTVFERFTRGY